MQWLEITINTVPEKIDGLTARLTDLGVEGLIIDDETEYRRFLDENRQYWDYVDEKLDAALRGVSRIQFYVEDSADGKAELGRLSAALPGEELLTRTVRDEDWENNWKQYYKPLPIGQKLLIVPQWEETPETNRTVMRLDPGLIFGTGSHPTTRMCLEELEEISNGQPVLDLGCGSGILSIAALLFGAKSAVGCDIDPKAPDVAMANASLNGIGGDRYSVFAGDVLADASMKRRLGTAKYGVVAANIVADVIIALSAHAQEFLVPGGIFLCSGIIDGREEEVRDALLAAGFTILKHKHDDGWNCFVCEGRKENGNG